MRPALVGALLSGPLALVALAAWTVLGTRSRTRTVATVPALEVGIVFGAETYPDGTPAPALAARLDVALRLWRAGRIERIIVSGDATSNDQVAVMADYLVARGLPEALVAQDPLGVDTYATCARALSAYGVQRATMISQDYHLPRILTICRLIGLDAYGVGDTSVRRGAPAHWWRSVRRELGANVKMLLDVARHRAPDSWVVGRSHPTTHQ